MGEMQHCPGRLFYGLLLPWCLSILVSRLCVTLILVTPSPAPSSIQSSPQRLALAVRSEQGHLSLPLIYIYFPCQLLFIGALRIWHTSLRES